jgi:hypothetical protein
VNELLGNWVKASIAYFQNQAVRKELKKNPDLMKDPDFKKGGYVGLGIIGGLLIASTPALLFPAGVGYLVYRHHKKVKR